MIYLFRPTTGELFSAATTRAALDIVKPGDWWLDQDAEEGGQVVMLGGRRSGLEMQERDLGNFRDLLTLLTTVAHVVTRAREGTPPAPRRPPEDAQNDVHEELDLERAVIGL